MNDKCFMKVLIVFLIRLSMFYFIQLLSKCDILGPPLLYLSSNIQIIYNNSVTLRSNYINEKRLFYKNIDEMVNLVTNVSLKS